MRAVSHISLRPVVSLPGSNLLASRAEKKGHTSLEVPLPYGEGSCRF